MSGLVELPGATMQGSDRIVDVIAEMGVRIREIDVAAGSNEADHSSGLSELAGRMRRELQDLAVRE